MEMQVQMAALQLHANANQHGNQPQLTVAMWSTRQLSATPLPSS